MQTWSFADGAWHEGDVPAASFCWFSLDAPEAEALDRLRDRFGLHPLAVEDCLSLNIHAPKIDVFQDHIFIVAVAPGRNGDRVTEEFDAFLAERFVITYSDCPLPQVGQVREIVAAGAQNLRPGPDGLLYEILDRMVDDFLPTANVIGDRLDQIEDEIVHDANQQHSRAILELRAHAGRLRRLLAPELMVIQRLSRGEFRYIGDQNRIYFRDIYDHLVRIDLALEGVREDAEMGLSTYLSTLNNRMSEVMKVLSLVAALALPANVIAGIFGTNFDNVPGLHSNWGFAFMIGAMAVLATSMAVYFKRRRWW